MEPRYPPLPVPVDVWHVYGDNHAVIGGRTDYIPEEVASSELPIPRMDGRWGPHEICLIPQIWDPQSPYMALCPIGTHPDMSFPPKTIMEFVMSKDSFVEHQSFTGLGGLNKSLWNEFNEEVNKLRFRVQDIQFHMSKDANFRRIQFPTEAVSHASQIMIYLRLSDIVYRDCLEAVAALQRTCAELQGFIIWSREAYRVRSSRSYSVRGAKVDNMQDYMHLFNLDIPVWMSVDLTHCRLPLAERHISITPLRSICDDRLWHDLPVLQNTESNMQRDERGILRLAHTKALFYYPPYVRETESFERAARGYAPRLDSLFWDKRTHKHINRLPHVAGGSTASKTKEPGRLSSHGKFSSRI